MPSSFPDLAVLSYGGASALAFLGLVLLVFRPAWPGLALVATAILAYGAYVGVLLKGLTEMQVLTLLGVGFFAWAGIATGWWTEKLGLRFRYPRPEVVYGAFIGLILGAVLHLGLFWEIIGLFVGAAIAAQATERKGVKDALLSGPVAVYWTLGPRGFSLLMALLVCDLGMGRILLPISPMVTRGDIQIVPGTALPPGADPTSVQPPIDPALLQPGEKKIDGIPEKDLGDPKPGATILPLIEATTAPAGGQ